jgi:hypothetical protein
MVKNHVRLLLLVPAAPAHARGSIILQGGPRSLASLRGRVFASHKLRRGETALSPIGSLVQRRGAVLRFRARKVTHLFRPSKMRCRALLRLGRAKAPVPTEQCEGWPSHEIRKMSCQVDSPHRPQMHRSFAALRITAASFSGYALALSVSGSMGSSFFGVTLAAAASRSNCS